MELNNERLKELPFVSYLAFMRDRIKSLSYSKGSNSCYLEAREIVQHIKRRYIHEMKLTDTNYHDQESGNMLRLNDRDLNDYNSSKSDKNKKYVIDRFKEDMDMDLNHLIIELENDKL